MAQQTCISSRCLVAVALFATYCCPALGFSQHGMLAGASRALSRGAGPLAARLGTKRCTATLSTSLRSFGAVPRSWHRSRYLMRSQQTSAALWRCRTCGAEDISVVRTTACFSAMLSPVICTVPVFSPGCCVRLLASSGARALRATVTGRDLDAQIKEQGDKVLKDGKMPRPKRRMSCVKRVP